MRHFPIFVETRDEKVVLAGGGDAAEAKLRLLLKTEFAIHVFAETASDTIQTWAKDGRITLHPRAFAPGDATGARLAYAANEDDHEDARVAAIARAESALINIVDNLGDSAFITPAMVDRDPVTIAIGTEGAAPVLAREIKADLEARLSPTLGTLAAIGKAFRSKVNILPMGRKRRDFWSDYYAEGEEALRIGGRPAVIALLSDLLLSAEESNKKPGRIDVIGTGPGEAELLTLKARNAIDSADIIAHDGDISDEILELARREAAFVDLSKGTTDLLSLARDGAVVARLKRGRGTPDTLVTAAAEAGIHWRLIAGLPLAPAQYDTLKQERA